MQQSKSDNCASNQQGITLELFGRALHSLAVRLYPNAQHGVQAVNLMLDDAAPAAVNFS
jgi:hypothetical protein